MKKKIFFCASLLIFSITMIICAIFMFNKVPNVETFTPKEGAMMAFGVMLCILSSVGIIFSFIVVGSSLDE